MEVQGTVQSSDPKRRKAHADAKAVGLAPGEMMKLWKTIGVALALTANLGCETPARLSGNRSFPREPAFSIEPETVTESSGLDFDAVYYRANDKMPGQPRYTGGMYYRFWPSGRVLKTATRGDGPPSAAEADGFRLALLGYYRVTGSRVDIELYVFDPGLNQWVYSKVKALIDENGDIVRTSSKIGNRTRESRDIFVKTRLDGMKRMPDW